MNTSEFLDRTTRFDGVLAGDSDYTRRRSQHLEWSQEAVDEFCLTRPFNWRLRPLTLNIASGLMAADLPDDFVEIGAIGSVLDTVTRAPLTERSPILIQEAQGQSPKTNHEIFAVFERSAATVGDPGELQFQIGANGRAQVFSVWYLSAPPTLVDIDAENSGLDRIPAIYHFSYLLHKVKAKIAFANESLRDYYDQQAMVGLNNAIRTHVGNPNSSPQAMPSAAPGKW